MTEERFRDEYVVPRFPVTCPHGNHVGWALRNEPTTVSDRRFCAPCPECNPVCRYYANGIQEHVYPLHAIDGTRCLCGDRQLGVIQVKETRT